MPFNALTIIKSLQYIGGGLILSSFILDVHFLFHDDNLDRYLIIGHNIFLISLPFWGSILLSSLDLSLVPTMLFAVLFLSAAGYGCSCIHRDLKNYKKK